VLRAKAAGDKQKKAVEAAAASRARMQASLLGGSNCRARAARDRFSEVLA